MKKHILILIICLPILLFSQSEPLKRSDISNVIQILFQQHFENKELNPTIMKRWLKVYIDYLDGGRLYLLQKEVDAFLQVDTQKAKNLIKKISKSDYSDFEKINLIFQRAVLRSKKWRDKAINPLVSKEKYESPTIKFDGFAQNETELLERQKQYYETYFVKQQIHCDLSDVSKRKKVVSLINKKMKRYESISEPFSKLYEHYLVLGILKSFAKSLDAHTAFFSNDEAMEMRKSLEKEYEGLGIVLIESVDGVMVTDIIANSPAQRCKQIFARDILMQINGNNIEELSFEEVMQKLKKNSQSEIHLGFQSDNHFKEVTLSWEPITLNEERLTYSYEKAEDGLIATLTLKSFYENAKGITSEQDIRFAMADLQKEGKIQGMILDLRDNAGGFLSQAIKVAGLFISNGIIVVSKYSNNQKRYLRTMGKKPLFQGPLIILTSKLSASAAEIVAQALQDYGVAVIVGDERTFGKGSIQLQTMTDESHPYFYKVTVGKYFTASGKSTQIEGVKADIVVPSYYYYYEFGERYLEFPLKADHIYSFYHDPLEDLDMRTKRWFQENYLPYLQRPLTVWKEMLPILQERSQYRISRSKDFQNFLNQKEKPQSDVQMQEAVEILKDMIQISQELQF